jgi:hypothetical protein
MTMRAVIELTDTAPTVAVMTRKDEHDTWRDVVRAVIDGDPSDRSEIEYQADIVLRECGFAPVEGWAWDAVSGDASAECERIAGPMSR